MSPAPNKHGLGIANGRWRIRCRDGRKQLYARAVVESALRGPIPEKLHVHHINGDSTDDRLENLQLVTNAQHQRLHKNGSTPGWSRKHKACVVCGEAKTGQHKAHGVCHKCAARRKKREAKEELDGNR